MTLAGRHFAAALHCVPMRTLLLTAGFAPGQPAQE